MQWRVPNTLRGSWRGRVPYLYYHYLQTGQSHIEFRKWIALFRGTERPDDDLIQFLVTF